ncbi:hypothetical protein KY285_035540 [Solanum tuberosum]|nr:hypothetical protein KY285_035540 [Solanum tuberosum]
MASKSNNLKKFILIPSTDSDGHQQSINGVNDANKVSRLPRWTKQEILILIQGKKWLKTRSIEPEQEVWNCVQHRLKRSGIQFHPTVKDKGQVFDILDHGNGNEEGLDLDFASEDLFDSGRSVVVGDDGLFSDVPQMNADAIPMLTSEQPHQPLSQVSPSQAGTRKPTTRGADKGRGQEGRKRKRNDSNTNDETQGMLFSESTVDEWQNGELPT